MKKIITSILISSMLIANVFATSFLDTSSTHWFYDAVTNVASEGLILGYNGKFNPYDSMSNIQFATIMVRLVDDSIDLTMKEGDAHWGSRAYEAGLELRIFTTSDFTPEDFDTDMSREMMASFAVKALELIGETPTEIAETSMIADIADASTDYVDAVVKAYSLGIIQGNSSNADGSVNFDPTGTMTRAAAATIVNNMIKEEDRAEPQLKPTPGVDNDNNGGGTVTPDASVEDGSNYEGQFGAVTVANVNTALATGVTLEDSDFNHDILYAGASANNAHNLPEGSYYIKSSSFVARYNGGSTEDPTIVNSYESGGFTLANGKSVYIGQSRESIEAMFGVPMVKESTGAHAYVDAGVTVYYTDSGRVSQFNILCTSFGNYVNSGMSFGTGNVTLGNTASSSDLGPGESWNEGSPLAVSVTIDGVQISMTYGKTDGKWSYVMIKSNLK